MGAHGAQQLPRGRTTWRRRGPRRAGVRCRRSRQRCWRDRARCRAQLRGRGSEQRRHRARHDGARSDRLDRPGEPSGHGAGRCDDRSADGASRRPRSDASDCPRHTPRDARGSDRERHPRQEPPSRRRLRPARRVAVAVHANRRRRRGHARERPRSVLRHPRRHGPDRRRRRGDRARRAAVLVVGHRGHRSHGRPRADAAADKRR